MVRATGRLRQYERLSLKQIKQFLGKLRDFDFNCKILIFKILVAFIAFITNKKSSWQLNLHKKYFGIEDLFLLLYSTCCFENYNLRKNIWNKVKKLTMIVQDQKNCIICFLYNFWPLLPKFYFCKEDWALRYASMPFWDLSNIS